MRLCGNLAMFLMLAWLAPGDSAGREKGRERKKGKTQNGVAIQGKFSGRGGERCTWTVTGEKQQQQQQTLKVTCLVVKEGKPDRGFTCEYTAEPALCPRYVTRPGAFWKQIARALQQRKRHLCRNAHEPVQARMCKSAPAGSHFRLVDQVKEIAMTTPAARAGLQEDTPTTECTRRADHQGLAQEKCGDAWASFCNLLFNMVQSKDC